MIKNITDPSLLKAAFSSIFRSLDPFTPAGRMELPIRVVLYPTYGYHLANEQFQALTTALSHCGEQKFFVSLVESKSDPFELQSEWESHWVCEEPCLDDYMNLPLTLENAIYSSTGSWGILVSHEDHALLACRLPFWNIFRKHYPNWNQDLHKFIKNWQNSEKESGSSKEWLQPFLNHLSPIEA